MKKNTRIPGITWLKEMVMLETKIKRYSLLAWTGITDGSRSKAENLLVWVREIYSIYSMY